MKIKDKIKKEKLRNYISLLKKYKQNVNIIGTTKRVELKSIIEDSLIFIKGEKDVLDIGTGSGIPGIPIKIINPNINISFLDKSRKKMNILRHLLYNLKIDFNYFLIGTAEKYCQSFSNKFDIILSRGMGSFEFVLKETLPFLKNGGTIYLWKPKSFKINKIKKNDYKIKNISIIKQKECNIVKLKFKQIQ